MPGCGTRTFAEPDHYEASLRQALIEAVVTPFGEFKARLTWAELHQLQLLHCEEDFPRIAWLALAPRLLFVTFAAASSLLPVWDGLVLQAGDIILHKRGRRLHHATRGLCNWGVIAIDPAHLEDNCWVLSGRRFPLPEGQTLRAPQRDAARLRRLHAQACRLAETKSNVLAHPQVARAIEQGLIDALVTCLAHAKGQDGPPASRHYTRIMIRFEEVLAEHLSQPLRMPDLRELIGVTDRALRSCCAEFLGISPTRYVLLRRLKQVRIALRDADPKTANVAELARGHGFTGMSRFSKAYQAAFDETPSTTLGRAPRPRFTRP